MNPESEYLRNEARELPPFTRLVAGVSEEVFQQMRGNAKLMVAIENAGYPWVDEEACTKLSEQFSSYEPYEIAAFAKHLEQEKGRKETSH